MLTIEKIEIFELNDYKQLLHVLKQRWKNAEKQSGVFRYKLNVQKEEILNGEFNFFVQLNTDRTSKRRPPETITSITPAFNGDMFNFNKATKDEILFECIDHIQNTTITYLINNSPLTKYHTLICPHLTECRPQILTLDAIKSAIDILSGFNNRCFRIGYNSPGALASVNHLHLQLLYVEQQLYVEDAIIHHLIGNVYKLDEKYPAQGLCFPLIDYMNKNAITDDLMKLIRYFCDKIIPHNVFLTMGNHENREILKIFVFPRNHMSNKQINSFNAAFCELSGYVPVGKESIYDSLTEESIMEKLKHDVGIIEDLDQQMLELFTE